MTATAPPAPARPSGPPPRPPRPPLDRPPDGLGLSWHNSGVRRTVLTFLGAALGVLPLCDVFRDRGWLIDVWLAMFVVLLPALLLRARYRVGPLQVWPGLVVLVGWLTVRFVPEHAIFGIIPTPGTAGDVNALMDRLHSTINGETAPVVSNTATTFAVCALAGLMVALLDLFVVVGRHSALAGLPLLVLYSACGTVRNHPVGMIYFVAAAAGYLVLLASDASDRRAGWGHRLRGTRERSARSARGLAPAGQRIAVLALALAVLVPLVLPTSSKNLLDQWLRGRSSNPGTGFGVGGSGSLSPFAALKGQLELSDATDLFSVAISDAAAGTQPFFVRTNVLSVFTGEGWRQAPVGRGEPLVSTGFEARPADDTRTVDAVNYRAAFTISGLTGNPPVFNQPVRMHGELGSAAWSPADLLLIGSKVQRGQTYTEIVRQLRPSVQRLAAAPDSVPASLQSQLRLPAMPEQVTSLVAGLTAGAGGPYARARAISDYFADPANGFRYSLATKVGDSGSDLVDFLNNKVGFCQQYAAAMAVMLRVAGVPARVVLGYAHQGLTASGTLSITTRDAHAWVEAYFAGVGWVPFNPTPTIGTPGGSASELEWAPHSTPQDQPSNAPSAAPSGPTTAPSSAPGAAPQSGPDTQAQKTKVADLRPLLLACLVVLLVVALLLTPALVRARRRRGRLRAATPDALWDELSDTAVDLGYAWSPARTPRQVALWLDGPAGPATAELTHLARAVERSRFAAPDSPNGTEGTVSDSAPRLRAELTAVRAGLNRGHSRRERLRAALLPTSLGWSPSTVLRRFSARLRRR